MRSVLIAFMSCVLIGLFLNGTMFLAVDRVSTVYYNWESIVNSFTVVGCSVGSFLLLISHIILFDIVGLTLCFAIVTSYEDYKGLLTQSSTIIGRSGILVLWLASVIFTSLIAIISSFMAVKPIFGKLQSYAYEIYYNVWHGEQCRCRRCLHKWVSRDEYQRVLDLVDSVESNLSLEQTNHQKTKGVVIFKTHDLEKSQAKVTELSRYASKNEKSTQKIKGLTTENQELRYQLAELPTKEAYDLSERKVVELQHEIKNLTSKRSQSNSSIVGSEGPKVAPVAGPSHQQVTTDMNNMKAQHDTTIQVLKASHATEKANMQATINGMQTTINGMQTTISGMQTVISSAHSKINSLNQAYLSVCINLGYSQHGDDLDVDVLENFLKNQLANMVNQAGGLGPTSRWTQAKTKIEELESIIQRTDDYANNAALFLNPSAPRYNAWEYITDVTNRVNGGLITMEPGNAPIYPASMVPVTAFPNLTPQSFALPTSTPTQDPQVALTVPVAAFHQPSPVTSSNQAQTQPILPPPSTLNFTPNTASTPFTSTPSSSWNQTGAAFGDSQPHAQPATAQLPAPVFTPNNSTNPLSATPSPLNQTGAVFGSNYTQAASSFSAQTAPATSNTSSTPFSTTPSPLTQIGAEQGSNPPQVASSFQSQSSPATPATTSNTTDFAPSMSTNLNAPVAIISQQPSTSPASPAPAPQHATFASISFDHAVNNAMPIFGASVPNAPSGAGPSSASPASGSPSTPSPKIVTEQREAYNTIVAALFELNARKNFSTLPLQNQTRLASIEKNRDFSLVRLDRAILKLTDVVFVLRRDVLPGGNKALVDSVTPIVDRADTILMVAKTRYAM